MKYVIAIIQPYRLETVLEQLTAKEIHLVTVSQVQGRGRQRGTPLVYRSHTETASLINKVKLEIAVNDDFVQPTIDAILSGAQSGEIGDGKIFVLDLEQVVRVRTGERSTEAIG